MGKQPAKCPKCGHQWTVDPGSTGSLACPQCQTPLKLPNSQPSAARRDPLIGRTLGEYEILGQIGRGGMGVVYRGRQTTLGRIVAVKTLPRSLASSQDYVARFYREARNAAALSNPHLVRIYAVGEAEGVHYLAMEFIDGEGLNDVLSREGPLEPERALRYLKQACSALATAHAAGIVHRDIKPSNLMVDAEGQVRLTDFGLAKRTEGDVSVTQTGQALATPLYVAPEVAQGGTADPRSDLYSLAATFYHLIAGRPPFRGETFTELVIKHVNETAPALGEVAPHVDRRLTRVIDKLLRKNPAARYQSAQELLAELEALGALEAGIRPAARATVATDTRTAPTVVASRRAAGPPTTAASTGQRRSVRGSRIGVVATVAVCALLLAACVVAWAVSRGGDAAGEKAAVVPRPPPPTPVREKPVEQPKADPREKEAEACFRYAERAAEQKQWRTVRHYLSRLESDYSLTAFYREHKRRMAALSDAARRELDSKPPEPERPTRDPALDWIDLTAAENLHYWQPVKGRWKVEAGQVTGGSAGALAILACGLPAAEDMEVTLEVMQSSGSIGDDVQVVLESDGECPALRLYWNGSGLCRRQGSRSIVVGRLPSAKGGQWVQAGLRVARGKAAAWIGDSRAEGEEVGGSKPRQLRFVQSTESATYRNIRFRVLSSDPAYREFYEQRAKGQPR